MEKQMIKQLNPEQKKIFYSMMGKFKNKTDEVWDKIFFHKKCPCGEKAILNCKFCNSFFFCGVKCEKRFYKFHKKNCISKRHIKSTDELNLQDIENSPISDMKNVIYNPVHNDKNLCFVCDSDKELKNIYGSIFCQKCIDIQCLMKY